MENTSNQMQNCTCGCKHNWTHKGPARLLLAIAMAVIIFSAGLIMGSHHRGFGSYGHRFPGYGMMGNYGMMRGTYAPVQDQSGNVYYGGARGMMRIQGATGTPTPGQVQNY